MLRNKVTNTVTNKQCNSMIFARWRY